MLILTTLALAALQDPAPAVDPRAEATRSYRALYQALDDDGLRELWRAHPDLILVTFDADLEKSLALEEEAPDGSRAADSQKLLDRALWGSTIGSEVTGQPILADYAVSFAGWDAEQKKSFRAGQAAYRRGMERFRAVDFDAALAAGAECREAAEPLGDWWGTAMGLTLEGMAHEARGEALLALRKTSRARLLNHQLGLAGAEYQNLRGMVSQLMTLERWERAHLAADAAVTLATARGDDAGVIENLRHRARIERALGFETAAQATEARIARLED